MGTGESGPFRSQLPKSRTLLSASKNADRRVPPRSLPASDMLSKFRLKPRLDGWRVFWGRSGRGPLRDQSDRSRLDSARSLAEEASQHTRFGYAKDG